MPVFADIMDEINATSNVEVNHEYDEVYVSYKLVAKAALVIGRQSSLGDEALSVGIPVLFHDWTPMRASNLSGAYGYDDIPVYVHSFDELAERTRKILDGGKYSEEHDFDQLREHYFSASIQSPKQVMMDHLHDMLHDVH
jgi:hypothetical protein